MLVNRIKSESGATILIALLFFLLCAVAGSVVLAAGTSASGRISGLVEKEQSFYSVSSAAKMLSAEIEGQEFDYYVDDSNNEYSFKTTPDSDVAQLLKNGAVTVFKNNDSTKSYEDNLTVSSTSTSMDSVKDVGGEFVMKGDYSIEIRLYSLKNGSEDKNSYVCRVAIPAVIKMNREKSALYGDNGKYTIEETDLIWKGSKIEKAE